jgi:hypothetical protein
MRPIGRICHLIGLRSKELQVTLARHKSRGVRAASIPLVCEVCREGLVTTLIADFIFACDRQAGITEHTKSEKDDSPRIIEETRQCVRDFEHVAEMTTAGELRDKMLSAHIVKP